MLCVWESNPPPNVHAVADGEVSGVLTKSPVFGTKPASTSMYGYIHVRVSYLPPGSEERPIPELRMSSDPGLVSASRVDFQHLTAVLMGVPLCLHVPQFLAQSSSEATYLPPRFHVYVTRCVLTVQ